MRPPRPEDSTPLRLLTHVCLSHSTKSQVQNSLSRVTVGMQKSVFFCAIFVNNNKRARLSYCYARTAWKVYQIESNSGSTGNCAHKKGNLHAIFMNLVQSLQNKFSVVEFFPLCADLGDILKVCTTAHCMEKEILQKNWEAQTCDFLWALIRCSKNSLAVFR